MSQKTISSIQLNESTIEINLENRLDGESLTLVGIPPYQLQSATSSYQVIQPQEMYEKTLLIPRYTDGVDRAYFGFQLFNNKGEYLSDPYFVDDWSNLRVRDFEIPWPESKKGLTCIVGIEDAISLGCKYSDEGIPISALIDWANPKPQITWDVDGEAIPINIHYVEYLDKRLKAMSEAGINFTPILINTVPTEEQPGNPLIHSNTDLQKTPYHHGAFNLSDEKGYRCYRAAVEFLAERYTRPDQQYGLISGIIIGNELQSHWAWHNMGEVSEDQVIKEYERCVRIAYTAARMFHEDLRVYISMEHHWTKRGYANDPLREIPGNIFLDKFNALALKQGNYPWHLAFHPYPENLFEPKFWNDRLALKRFDTPKITFNNLEVLPVYLRQERFLYQGLPRRIILSEQGFHAAQSPDGEKEQAAAFAAAYYKVSHMPEIDSFILHRHVSARDECGLRLGLWNWHPDSISGFDPGEKVFIYEVFKQADTTNWESAFEFAKPIIGIKDWQEMLPDYEIDQTPPQQIIPDEVVYDFCREMNKAKVQNSSAWQSEIFLKGGPPIPSILHHPPSEGSGGATFHLPSEIFPEGREFQLVFETGFTAKTDDGVRFAILVDDKEIWSAEQVTVEPVLHTINLGQRPVREMKITFQVNMRANPSYDSANWIQPQILLKK